MNSAQPIQLDTPQDLSLLLKAAGDDLRLDILRIMAQDSFGVLELCQLFDCKQSGMSHHLKVLATAGWVSSRREGNSIFYRRAYLPPDHTMAELQQTLFATLDRQPLSAEQTQRLRSEEHTSELQSRGQLVCRLLLEKKKHKRTKE